MSGTSMDGLDIAHCSFVKERDVWSYSILEAETVPYPEEWVRHLKQFPSLNGSELIGLHVRYGRFLGEQVHAFVLRHSLRPDFVASHGHTVFHQPKNGVTFQAGDGSALATVSRLPVVYDFRSADVAMGGQGAPLVPVGDRLLFYDFSHCLNLGGIANISFEKSGQRVAFDVCPCNLLLNHLSNLVGKEFDEGGKIASKGKIIPELLQKLDELPYYSLSGPKSLGREDIEMEFLSLFDGEMEVPDLLQTSVEHIAGRVAEVIRTSESSFSPVVLATGGGAWNSRLVQRISERSGATIHVPEKKLVDFKEALVFAFLGVLRWEETVNVYSSVTGALSDHCAGSVVLP